MGHKRPSSGGAFSLTGNGAYLILPTLNEEIRLTLTDNNAHAAHLQARIVHL